jgi:hypothetical protein
VNSKEEDPIHLSSSLSPWKVLYISQLTRERKKKKKKTKRNLSPSHVLGSVDKTKRILSLFVSVLFASVKEKENKRKKSHLTLS